MKPLDDQQGRGERHIQENSKAMAGILVGAAISLGIIAFVTLMFYLFA
jgi:hypothetical protein